MTSTFVQNRALTCGFAFWLVCVVLHQFSSSRGPGAAQSDATLASVEPQAVSSNGSGIGLRSSWIRRLRS